MSYARRKKQILQAYEFVATTNDFKMIITSHTWLLKGQRAIFCKRRTPNVFQKIWINIFIMAKYKLGWLFKDMQCLLLPDDISLILGIVRSFIFLSGYRREILWVMADSIGTRFVFLSCLPLLNCCFFFLFSFFHKRFDRFLNWIVFIFEICFLHWRCFCAFVCARVKKK